MQRKLVFRQTCDNKSSHGIPPKPSQLSGAADPLGKIQNGHRATWECSAASVREQRLNGMALELFALKSKLVPVSGLPHTIGLYRHELI